MGQNNITNLRSLQQPPNALPLSFAQGMITRPETQDIVAQLTKAFKELTKFEPKDGIGRNLNLVDTNTLSPQQKVMPAEAGSSLNQFA